MRNLLAWWIRLHRRGAFIGLQRAVAAVQRARQERIDREVLARLDARTLRDIGLESWNGMLAERLQAYRQRQWLRLAAARIGAY